MPSTVCIVGGSGYVGLGYAVALADLGHRVIGLDISEDRVATLNSGKSPIFEPRLEELLQSGLASGNLSFTTSYSEAIPQSEFVFLCVGTPALRDGEADLRQVRSAAASVGQHLVPGRHVVVINKSTMPVGTAELVERLVGEHAPANTSFSVVSNPEFLREGRAVRDIFSPSRIVLGSGPSPLDRESAERVAALFGHVDCPVLITDRRTAEMIKYASNAFLATKISFINEVAGVCERLGADIVTVAEGMGLDPRIGGLFLRAGLGFGGSCFPKDVGALTKMADEAGLHPGLLRAVLDINRDVRSRFVVRADRLLNGLDGKTIAIWGLSFKENTDDLRESPSIDVVASLLERGATVRAYDPAAMEPASRIFPTVQMTESLYDAAHGADAVLVCTPWKEFKEVDLTKVAGVMRGSLFFDGRNLFNPAAVIAAGLYYEGMGRGNINNGQPVEDLSQSTAQVPLA